MKELDSSCSESCSSILDMFDFSVPRRPRSNVTRPRSNVDKLFAEQPITMSQTSHPSSLKIVQNSNEHTEEINAAEALFDLARAGLNVYHHHVSRRKASSKKRLGSVLSANFRPEIAGIQEYKRIRVTSEHLKIAVHSSLGYANKSSISKSPIDKKDTQEPSSSSGGSSYLKQDNESYSVLTSTPEVKQELELFGKHGSLVPVADAPKLMNILKHPANVGNTANGFANIASTVLDQGIKEDKLSPEAKILTCKKQSTSMKHPFVNSQKRSSPQAKAESKSKKSSAVDLLSYETLQFDGAPGLSDLQSRGGIAAQHIPGLTDVNGHSAPAASQVLNLPFVPGAYAPLQQWMRSCPPAIFQKPVNGTAHVRIAHLIAKHQHQQRIVASQVASSLASSLAQAFPISLPTVDTATAVATAAACELPSSIPEKQTSMVTQEQMLAAPSLSSDMRTASLSSASSLEPAALTGRRLSGNAPLLPNPSSLPPGPQMLPAPILLNPINASQAAQLSAPTFDMKSAPANSNQQNDPTATQRCLLPFSYIPMNSPFPFSAYSAVDASHLVPHVTAAKQSESNVMQAGMLFPTIPFGFAALPLQLQHALLSQAAAQAATMAGNGKKEGSVSVMQSGITNVQPLMANQPLSIAGVESGFPWQLPTAARPVTACR